MRIAAILTLLVGMLMPVTVRSADTTSMDGEINGLKALRLLYGEMTEDGDKTTEPAIWRNVKVPDELKEYFNETTAKVSVAFEARYKEKGKEKYVVITQACPYDAEYGCHACAPLIGGAIFFKEGNRWSLESESRFIAVLGKYGMADPMELVKVGAEQHGVLIKGDDMNQGYESHYFGLVVAEEGVMGLILGDAFEGPTGGACPDPAAKNKQGIAVAFIDNPKSRYGNVKVTKRMNTGSCGRVKSVTLSETYVFKDGDFVKEKAK